MGKNKLEAFSDGMMSIFITIILLEGTSKNLGESGKMWAART